MLLSNAKQFFCLECDVLLMRLSDKPDLASLRDEMSAVSVEGDAGEAYVCPDCGKVATRGTNGELVEVRA